MWIVLLLLTGLPLFHCCTALLETWGWPVRCRFSPPANRFFSLQYLLLFFFFAGVRHPPAVHAGLHAAQGPRAEEDGGAHEGGGGGQRGQAARQGRSIHEQQGTVDRSIGRSDWVLVSDDGKSQAGALVFVALFPSLSAVERQWQRKREKVHS